jgi:hypothetical protein
MKALSFCPRLPAERLSSQLLKRNDHADYLLALWILPISRQFNMPLFYWTNMARAACLLVYCCIPIFALLLVVEMLTNENAQVCSVPDED